jgi:hypothetical protein
MWANRGGFAGPLEVQPRVGPFVDVLYVEDGNDQIVPCVAALPLRAEGAFHRLGTYRLDVQVTNSDPIALRVRPGTTGPTPSVQVERIDPYPGNDELVATTQIEQLRGQIAELTEDTRRVTRDQRRRFGQAVPKVLPELFESPPRFEYKGVRVTYGSTIEAQNYAEELSRLFGENGLTTSRAEEFTHESLNTTGLKVHVADPSNPIANDRKTMALLDAAGIDYEIEERTTEFPEITVLRVGRTVSR